MAEGLGCLTLWKLRDMRRLWPRPRAMRLPKQARALKSLLAEARSAGLVPATDLPKRRGRPARPRAELGAPPFRPSPKRGTARPTWRRVGCGTCPPPGGFLIHA
jgi:hypothetical protein